MQTDTKDLIDNIKNALGDDFTGAVHESTGPDGIKNFPSVDHEHAEMLLRLAIEDEAELGRIMAKQIIEHLTSCCAAHNTKLDLAA